MSNQLIKIENEANFSPSELIIIKARQDIPLCQINSIQLESVVSDLVYQIHHYCGYKINDTELEILMLPVMQDLLTSFKHQTLEEIKLAFNNGSRKEYGEFIGLPPGRFNEWIRAFLADRKRTDALAKELRLKEKDVKLPTKEELYQSSKSFALNAFETFKQEEHYNDIGNPVYEFLDGLNLIPFTIERKTEIYEQAKTKIVAKNNPIAAINLAEKTKFEKILEGIEAKGKDGKEIVRVEARKMALNLFFKELVEMETELSELLDN